MKKFVKWFLYSLFVVGIIALAICYMVIPQETKSAVDVIVGYANTPLGIVGGTTITLGAVAYIVISHLLKLHRDELKKNYEKFKEESQEKQKKLEEKYEKLYCEYKQLKEHTSSIENGVNKFANNIVEAVKLIPNKKVQERLEQLNEKDQKGTNDKAED